jgi:hypothetical protein
LEQRRFNHLSDVSSLSRTKAQRALDRAQRKLSGCWRRRRIGSSGIDFWIGPKANCAVLEVEETRICISPTDVEHREIRWRRATLPEAWF